MTRCTMPLKDRNLESLRSRSSILQRCAGFSCGSLSNNGGRCGCQALDPIIAWILYVLRRFYHPSGRVYLYLLWSSVPYVVPCSSTVWRHPRSFGQCPFPYQVSFVRLDRPACRQVWGHRPIVGAKMSTVSGSV